MVDENETPDRPVRSNYPPNSHKSKDVKSEKEKPKVEQITVGTAIQRKKPLGRRIAETFTGDDARSVGHYVLFEVLLPAAKSMFLDALTQGGERMLYGESRRSSAARSGTGYTSYNRMHSSAIPDPRSSARREISSRARATHNFDEVVLATRGEAESVLDALGAIIDSYDMATVTDLYDLVGITGSFTDDKWGWFDLRGARTVQVRNGYLLDLPQTQPVD